MMTQINSTDANEAQPAKLDAGLYLVSTPIGNLRDITLRALDTLKACDLVLCEDTRMTGKLLSAYRINAKMAVYNDHADAGDRHSALTRIEQGGAVALVSDAGTPLVSDPGFKLVHAAQKAGLPVIPVPGANALLPALQLSAMPTDRFLFGGFIPRTSAARTQFFADVKHLRATLVFYESPNRLDQSIESALGVLGDRPVALARELTKMFETCTHGTLAQWAADPTLMGTLKGECVLIIGGQTDEAATEGDVATMLRNALKTQSVKDAASFVSAATGHPKKAVYDMALKLRDET